MNEVRVFLSYARIQHGTARALADRLRQHGIPVWIDTLSIPSSVEWFREIELGIAGSHLFVALDSPEWRASEVSSQERELAAKLDAIILTLTGTDSPDELERAVLETIAQVDESDLTDANLLGDTSRWVAAGRPRYLLATGADIKRYLRHVRLDHAPPLPVHLGDVREFVKKSRRRRMWTRVRVAAAALTTVLLYAVAQLPSQLVEKVEANSKQLVEQAVTEKTYRAKFRSDPVGALLTPAGEVPERLAGLDPQALAAHFNLPFAISRADGVGTSLVSESIYSVEADAGDLRITDAEGRLVMVQEFDSPVTAHAVAPTERLVAAASGSRVLILDLENMTVFEELLGAPQNVVALSWPDTGRLTAHTQSGYAVTWRLGQAALVHEGESLFLRAAKSGDGSKVAGLSRDLDLVIVDAATSRTESLRPFGVAELAGGGVTAYGQDWVVWGGAGGSTQVVVVSSSGEIGGPLEIDCDVSDLVHVSHDSFTGYCPMADRIISLDARKGATTVAETVGLPAAPTRLAVADGQTVFAATWMGATFWWDARTARPEPDLAHQMRTGCAGQTGHVAYSPAARIKASVFSGGSECITLASIDSLEVNLSVATPQPDGFERPTAVQFSDSGEYLAVGFATGMVWIVKPGDHETVYWGPLSRTSVRGIEFVSEDSELMLFNGGGEVRKIALADILPGGAGFDELMAKRVDTAKTLQSIDS